MSKNTPISAVAGDPVHQPTFILCLAPHPLTNKRPRLHRRPRGRPPQRNESRPPLLGPGAQDHAEL